MKLPIVSIIVPVYNVEKYLPRCIDSILAQTFQDYEVLLVDDGSMDRSDEICDQYEKKDTSIRVIHKENGGISDDRNVGILKACGQYLCFIDSDDFIKEKMIEVLYHLIQKYNADLSICGICDFYVSGAYNQTEKVYEFSCTGKEALADTLIGEKIPGSVCTKLISRKIMEGLAFVKGRTYEDAFLTPDLFKNTNIVACTTESLYCYWHREGSITTRRFTKSSLDVIDAYQYTLQIIREYYPDLEQVALFRLYWSYFVVLDRMLSDKSYKEYSEYGQVVSYLKKNWLKIIQCTYFQKSRRIAVIALKINVHLYRILLKKKIKLRIVMKDSRKIVLLYGANQY